MYILGLLTNIAEPNHLQHTSTSNNIQFRVSTCPINPTSPHTVIPNPSLHLPIISPTNSPLSYPPRGNVLWTVTHHNHYNSMQKGMQITFLSTNLCFHSQMKCFWSFLQPNSTDDTASLVATETSLLFLLFAVANFCSFVFTLCTRTSATPMRPDKIGIFGQFFSVFFQPTHCCSLRKGK